MDLLIGIVLPPVIDVVGKDVKNDKLRFLFAALISLMAAVLIDLPKLQTGDWMGILQTTSIVFAEAQVIFNLYWKESLLRDKLQSKVSTLKVVSDVSGGSGGGGIILHEPTTPVDQSGRTNF